MNRDTPAGLAAYRSFKNAVLRRFENEKNTEERKNIKMSKEEEMAMAFRKSSQLQVLQVSRGADKVMQMIDSWVNSPNLDGRSRDIGRDLFRSASDLQESLVMLGKVSKMMPLMKGDSGVEVMVTKRYETGVYDDNGRRQGKSGTKYSNNRGEMKKVIRDSLCGQNLLSISSDNKMASSSSRSLNFPMESCYDGNCSFSTERTNARTPNLIAKIMGLQQIPSDNIELDKREPEKKRSTNFQEINSGSGMQDASELQLFEQNLKKKRESLKDFMRKVQLERVLKRCELKDLRSELDSSETLQPKNPSKISSMNAEVPSTATSQTSQPRGEVHKDQSNKVHDWKEKTRSVKANPEKRIADNDQLLFRKVEEKEPKSSGKTEFKPCHVEETLPYNQQRKDASKTRKKDFKELKPVMIAGKPGRKEHAKEMREPKAAVALAKPEQRLVSGTSTNTNALRKYIRTPLTEPIKQSSITRKKRIKGAESIIIGIETKKKLGGQLLTKEDNSSELTMKIDTAVIEKDAKDIHLICGVLPADGFPKQSEQDSRAGNTEHMWKDQKLLPRIKNVGRSPESAIDTVHLSKAKLLASGIEAEIADDLQQLFLSSKSFLRAAKKLFGLESNLQANYQISKGIQESRTASPKLLLGCAMELLARKRHRIEAWKHPMNHSFSGSPGVYFSLNQLVDEISKGMQRLDEFYKSDSKVSSGDVLYLRLEKDLRCKEMWLNSIWDFGWEDFVCTEEADIVVGQVEEHLICMLVEEVALEFL